MKREISLNEPVVVVLTPQQVQIVMQGLNELPFKYSSPVIDHLLTACENAQKQTDENTKIKKK